MRNPLLAALKALHRSVGGHGLGRIRFLKILYEAAFRWLRPRQVRVQGHLMVLDDRDTLELATREVYEPLETGLLLRYVVPGTLVVDIGANIGYYTLLAARATGPGGQVIAFEPEPANRHLLSTNIALNGYGNVEVRAEAVSDREGEARLFLNDVNRGDHRLIDPGDGRPSVRVKTVTLDTALKNVQAGRAFVKMDVQGHEWNAFQGMRETLARVPQVALVTEFWPRGLSASGADPRRLPEALRQDGFDLYLVDEKVGHIRPVTEDEAVAAVPAGSDDYTTLLALKGLEPDPAWQDKEGD